MHNNAALRLWGICIWNGHPVDKIENLSLYLSSGLSPVYIPESSKWQAFQLIHYVFSTTNKKNLEKSCRKNIIWYMDHLWHIFRHFWLDPTVIYKKIRNYWNTREVFVLIPVRSKMLLAFEYVTLDCKDEQLWVSYLKYFSTIHSIILSLNVLALSLDTFYHWDNYK